jgi:hypothetical protein
LSGSYHRLGSSGLDRSLDSTSSSPLGRYQEGFLSGTTRNSNGGEGGIHCDVETGVHRVGGEQYIGLEYFIWRYGMKVCCEQQKKNKKMREAAMEGSVEVINERIGRGREGFYP